MPRIFETEYIGKSHITSHFCRCDSCKRLTMLSTYSTVRFLKILNMPAFPVGKFRMIDECPQCGNRNITSARKYEKERKRNLSLMMEGFAEEADNPQNCVHALHTLMIYNMESWFHDVQKSYGIRFGNDMRIQFLIAQGLSRFGNYQEAITYCQKAITLGYGRLAEELMEYCQTLSDASEGIADLEALKIQPEPVLKAYIPMATLLLTVTALLAAIGINSLRNSKAWIINGSLQKYTFSIDEKTYELEPGATRQISLTLGNHVLETDSMPPHRFTYSIPLLKQLVKKSILVINPDTMALLAVEDSEDTVPESDTIFAHSDQIHIFPGLSARQYALRRITNRTERKDPVGYYRPDTHMAMVQLMNSIGLKPAAIEYARSALKSNPDTAEAEKLLQVALKEWTDEKVLAFLQPELESIPTKLPWHLYYQEYMRTHHPGHDLESEYTQRCKTHADEPASYFLLAKVVHNKENAYRFFEHADRKNGMKGLGNYSIASDLYNRASFSEALPYIRKAIQLDPENTNFLRLKENILLALHDYDTLLEETQESSGEPNAERLIRYLTCAGYHQQADAKIAKLSETPTTEIPRLNAIRYYCVGNIRDYLECRASEGIAHATFEKALHTNQIEDADDLLKQADAPPYWEHLILYCAAQIHSLPKLAEQNFKKAIQKTETENNPRHRIAEMLAGKSIPTEETVRSLDIDAPEKAILCMALGYRFPEKQKPFSALAEVYNFTPAYPQLLIRKWIREQK